MWLGFGQRQPQPMSMATEINYFHITVSNNVVQLYYWYIYIFFPPLDLLLQDVSPSLFFFFLFFLYFHFTSGAGHLNIHKKLSLSAISTKIDTNNVQDIHFRKSTLAIRKFKMAASFQDGCRSKPDKLQFLKWNSN